MGELLAGGPATAAAAGHVVPDQVADNAPTAGGGADRTQHLPVLLMVLTINKVNKNHEKNFKTQRKLIIMKNICTRTELNYPRTFYCETNFKPSCFKLLFYNAVM